MKRNLLTALCLILFGFPVVAETVMIYTTFPGIDLEEHPEALNLISAVEEGIMALFFDSGFIVFNAYDENRTFPFPERDSLILAKSGGADLLLELELFLETEGGIIFLDKVEYRFFETIGDLLLSGGTRSTSEEEGTPFDKSYAVGELVANDVLSARHSP